MKTQTDFVINGYSDKNHTETDWKMVRTQSGAYRNVQGKRNFLRRGVNVTQYVHLDLNTPYLLKFYDGDSTDYLVVEFNRVEQTDNERLAYFREVKIDSEPLDSGVYSDYMRVTLYKGEYESQDHTLILLPIANIRNMEFDKVATRYRKPIRDLKELPSNNLLRGDFREVDAKEALSSPDFNIIDIIKLKKDTSFLIFKNTKNGVEFVGEDKEEFDIGNDEVKELTDASDAADEEKIPFDDLLSYDGDLLVAKDIVNVAEKGRNPYIFFKVIDREEDYYNIEIYKSISKKLNNAYPDKSFVAYPGDKTKTSRLSINKKNDMYSYLGEVYKIDGISSYIESLTPYNDIPRVYTISSLD